jgi:acetyltransferase-like isoleucine patch superfamily enzyme
MGYGTVVIGKFRLAGSGQISIGDNSRLENVKLVVDGRLLVGENVFLNGASIVSKQSVSIGDECLISDAYITDTDFHNIEPELRRAPPGPRSTRPIEIGRNVWIGDRGVILKGSTIGNDSVIGSNGVVRGNVPARSLCIGNPAMVVKTFD